MNDSIEVSSSSNSFDLIFSFFSSRIDNFNPKDRCESNQYKWFVSLELMLIFCSFEVFSSQYEKKVRKKLNRRLYSSFDSTSKQAVLLQVTSICPNEQQIKRVSFDDHFVLSFARSLLLFFILSISTVTVWPFKDFFNTLSVDPMKFDTLNHWSSSFASCGGESISKLKSLSLAFAMNWYQGD